MLSRRDAIRVTRELTRLRYWGNDVRCAITDHTNDGRILFLRLDDLQPHHWTQAYLTSELEHFDY